MGTLEMDIEIITEGKEKEPLVVEFIADISVENDGIGSYEYWGFKGYDKGVDYPVVDTIYWNKEKHTEEENKIINEYFKEYENWLYDKFEKKLKLYLTIVGIIITFSSSAQKTDSVFIVKIVDEMSDNSYLLSSRKMVIHNKEMTRGFSLEGDIKLVDGKPKVTGVSSVLIAIGQCQENVELILMFSDSTKIKLKSWNKFNCKGNAWFDITDKDAEKLSKLKLIKAKITNGATFDSFVHEVEEDQDYFIRLFNAASTNNVKERKK